MEILTFTYFCVRFLLVFISPTQDYYLYIKWLHNVLMRNIKRLMAGNRLLYMDYLVNKRYASRMVSATWFTLEGLQYRIANKLKKRKISFIHIIHLVAYTVWNCITIVLRVKFQNDYVNGKYIVKVKIPRNMNFNVYLKEILHIETTLFDNVVISSYDESNIFWYAIWKKRLQFIYYGYISCISKYSKPRDYSIIQLYIWFYTNLNHWRCMQLFESHFRE